ncbi:hypothetical protein KSP39_PZI015720 [Platanthera zijinensis]|uniref:Uncharacterized protein n=1 Tax=Platanthera zijinensis TaxID=2320716 RepID=A0AAP0B951_9ASPA
MKIFMDPECLISLLGAFRDDIREFLQRCCDVECRPTEGMPTRCTLIVDEKKKSDVASMQNH